MTSEERSPSEDCALDGEQFFELNVPSAMSTGNSGSKPIRLECTANPFGAAGISVDMQGRAFRAKNVYAIPGAGNGSPPLEVALDSRGQALKTSKMLGSVSEGAVDEECMAEAK